MRFSQDPVRMIRLIKFVARLGFEIDKPALNALLTSRKEITKSSPARILEELLRMLESGASKTFFHLLNEYGMLQALLPEFSHYLKIKPETTLFALLAELDSEVKKHHDTKLDRGLLLSALLFPLFDEYLKKHLVSAKKTPHLGLIAQSANHVIDCVFTPFFSIPRRIRSIVAFIITSQYRFIPLDGRALKKARRPSDPAFPTALHLLKLRTNVETELLPHYTFWTESSFDANVQKTRPRRRRKVHET